MQTSEFDRARHVIPRWRSLARTPPHELSFSRKARAKSSGRWSGFLALAIEQWRKTETLEDAADAIDAALLAGNYEMAVGPALQVDRHRSATPQLKAAARQILKIDPDRPTPMLPAPSVRTIADIHGAIRKQKKRLIDFPRDALGHVEIARLHALIGQLRPAEKDIGVALSLAPDDRFVLRSATRLLLHSDDPSRAVHALWRSEAVRTDPWVQAAEIAAAEASGLSPRWAPRRLKEVAAGGKCDISCSELAVGLATLELHNGAKRRHVRRLAEAALMRPTENALLKAFG